MNNSIFNYQLTEDTVIFNDTIKKNLPCSYNIPRDHESIFFVTKGNLLYEKNEIKEIIKEGQIGYIQRGSIDKSSAYLCDEVSYIATNFRFNKENKYPKKTLPFKALASQGISYNYEKLFKEAMNIFSMKTPGHITICNGILLQIIGLLYNELKIEDINFKKMHKLENAIEYIKKYYNNSDFKISHLSYITNMSEKKFRRIFFDVYKKTPYVFLQEFRINKSQILLLNTSKSISEIAVQCGFSDVYSFSHCFKKHIGVSPSQYKNTQN